MSDSGRKWVAAATPVATIALLGIVGACQQQDAQDRSLHWWFGVGIESQQVSPSAAGLDSAPLDLGAAWVTIDGYVTYPLVNPEGGEVVQLVSPFDFEQTESGIATGWLRGQVYLDDFCIHEFGRCGKTPDASFTMTVEAPSERLIDPPISRLAGMLFFVDGQDDCLPPTAVEVWQTGCFLDGAFEDCDNRVVPPSEDATYPVGPFRVHLWVDTDGCPVAD